VAGTAESDRPRAGAAVHDDLRGLARPWDLLEAYLEDFERESVLFGTGYIGWGIVGGSGLQAAIPHRAADGAATARRG